MGHEHHFLSRLDRVSLPHVELALELYRDHELLRFLLEGSDLPEAAERVAISLADPQGGPFLIVTRQGRFVTCLGEGMHVGGLPVITRTQLDGAIVRHTVSRAKHEERLRVRAAQGGTQALFRRIFTAGDELTAEEVQTLAAFQSLLAPHFLRLCVETVRDTALAMTRILSLLKRTERPKPHTYPTLQAYWQGVWAVGHLAILGTMGGSQVFERSELPERVAPAIMRGTMFTGVFRLGQMGLWSVAKLGKPVLATFKHAYDTADDFQRLLEAALALTVLGLRHTRLQAEARKAISPAPPKGHPELAEYAKFLSINAHRVLDDPEPLLKLQRGVGANFVVRLSRSCPGALPSFERAEDVPDELALRLAVQDTGSFLHDQNILLYLFACLPWLARTSAETLYWPADLLRATRTPWSPEDTIRIMRPWVESERAHARSRPEGPSRQGPCPCGSGKKYKRCCEKVET